MRLTLTNGAQVTLVNATMQNDTIVGLQQGFGLEEGVGIARNRVRSIEIQRPNTVASAIVATGVAVASVLVFQGLRAKVRSDR